MMSMKDLRNKIMDYLLQMDNMNKENLILILNPLDTEEQAKEYLQFLQTNKKQLTTKDLIKKALEVAGKN